MATAAARRWELSRASFGRVSGPWVSIRTVCGRATSRGSHGIREATLAYAIGERFHNRPSLVAGTRPWVMPRRSCWSGESLNDPTGAVKRLCEPRQGFTVTFRPLAQRREHAVGRLGRGGHARLGGELGPARDGLRPA